MSAFSPEFSKVFKVAAFSNLISTLPFLLIRIGVLSLFGVLSVFSINSTVFYFWVSLFSLNLMFEIFYHFNVSEYKTRKMINEEIDNIAQSFNIQSAKIILKAPDWSHVSSLLKSLLGDKKIKSFFAKAGFNKEEVEALAKASANDPLDIQKLVLTSYEFAKKEKNKSIDQIDLLLALFSESNALKQAVFSKQLNDTDLGNIAYWTRHLFTKSEIHFWDKSPYALGLGLASLWEGGWTLETEKFSKNINNEILGGKIKNHLVGRGDVINQVEKVLSRSSKRNVILIGEPGVGKTTVVYGLAQRSAHGNLPESLKYKRFLELDLSALLASAGGGELQERLNNLLTEISHASDVVLFIPQIEFLTTSEGGGADITGLLINTLKGSGLQVIGTTTLEEYKKNIEPKVTFAEAFESVEISPPSRDMSIRILEEAATNIELKNKITVSYKAIEKAVDLSLKFMPDRTLPGVAINLLDEAATATSLERKRILIPELIEQIVSQKTKAPVTFAKGEESKKLLNLEKELHKRIIDQEEAIKSVSEAIRRARTLHRDSSHPIGVFLFLGPTGVGKTETAKALASIYFGSEERIIREDMSEYQEEQSINRLIGAPQGTGGNQRGQFTEKIRENPFTVVLLDEMEKANPKIQQAFLPIFDEGKIEDSSGKQIIFTNSIIIATSNAGAEFIRESIQSGKSAIDIKKPLLEKLQRENIFRPEFLNRFDDIVVFKPLSPDEVKQIVGLLSSQLAHRLKKQDIDIKFDDASLDLISKKGFDPTYGARPLRRVLQNEVESTLSKKILSGEIARGSKVLVSTYGDKLTLKPLP